MAIRLADGRIRGVLGAGLALNAYDLCGGCPAPAVEPVPTIAPTATATVTASPTASATATPSATASATATPDPVASATPAPIVDDGSRTSADPSESPSSGPSAGGPSGTSDVAKRLLVRRRARVIRRETALSRTVATVTLLRPTALRVRLERCDRTRCRTISRRTLDLPRGTHRITLRDAGLSRRPRAGAYRMSIETVRLNLRIR